MLRKCVNCPNRFEIGIRNRNTKYCDICKLEIWKIQKRDWKRKQKGTYGKKRNCQLCSIELDNDSKTDRLYCVNCAIIRDKILHQVSYRRRFKLKH